MSRGEKKQWKIGLIGLGIGVLVILTGNRLINLTEKNSNSHTLEEETLQNQDRLQQESMDEVVDDKVITDYEIEKRVYTEYSQSNQNEECNVNIFYPYITNKDNIGIEKKLINQSIKKEITKYCDISDGINSYEVDYEIKYMGKDYLSILFQGMRIPKGGAHPVDIAWGTTIDLSTGELANIADFIEDGELEQKLIDKEFYTKRGMDINIYEETMGEVDWYQKYQECSLNTQGEDHNNDFYVTDENIGIIFGVSHAIGDYIIVEIEKSKSFRLNETSQKIVSHADYGIGIDYDFINENHVILAHNICESPNYDYENTPLAEYLREDVEYDREMEKAGLVATLEIEYFTYDFNADGLEDYLVCMHGFLWGGSGGNTVRIYIQDKDESLRRVMYITVRLHEPNFPNEHDAIAVLDEMTGGYYAIVLPGTNRILRYDEDTGEYEFQEGE